jgi:transposase
MRLEPRRLVFVDETGTTTKMTRLRGRCPKGQRLLSKVPFGHWKTQTFVAGLRCGALTAPSVIDAPMDRRIFETYVETQLAPTLQPGDVVILDNLPAHKSAAAEAAIRAKGAWLLFLPPYSPDLNPIEMAFAKLKALLRQGDQDHRRPLASHRRNLRSPQSPRMPKLLHRRRSRIHMKVRCSRSLSGFLFSGVAGHDASETHACPSDDLFPDDARARSLPPTATAWARRFSR